MCCLCQADPYLRDTNMRWLGYHVEQDRKPKSCRSHTEIIDDRNILQTGAKVSLADSQNEISIQIQDVSRWMYEARFASLDSFVIASQPWG